jgi:hypothetical protein
MGGGRAGPWAGFARRAARGCARALLGLGLLAVLAWGAAALWFDGPAWRPAAGALAAGYLAGSLALLAAVRPCRRGLALTAGLFGGVLAWWLAIPPSNDRDWQPDVARTATAEIEGDRVRLRNLRDFRYRSETDYDERWEERSYDLSRLRGLDLFVSDWGAPGIVHTIMSFEFEDSPPLAISIETRKERGESYSALRGFFRQYELYFVVADERDVIRLRTDFRGERVHLYRLNPPPERVRALLLAYLGEVNRLAARPRWYNALTHNCTTTIRLLVLRAGVRNPWNWRLLVNRHAPELLYLRGTVNTERPFAELERRSDVTERARSAGDAPDFSRRLREGLPARPPPPGGAA